MDREKREPQKALSPEAKQKQRGGPDGISKLTFLGLWGSQEVLSAAVRKEEISQRGLEPWMGQQIGLGSNPGTTTSHLIFFRALL